MSNLRQAAQQALDALTNCTSEYGHRCNRCDSEVDEGGKVVEALRAALAQEQAKPATTEQQVSETPPSDYRRGYWDGFNIGKREGRIEAEDAAKQAEPVQEPVAWMNVLAGGYKCLAGKPIQGWTPLYLAPPQRPLLTDEEIVDAVRDADLDWQAGWTLDEHEPNRFTTLARAIERKVRGEA